MTAPLSDAVAALRLPNAAIIASGQVEWPQVPASESRDAARAVGATFLALAAAGPFDTVPLEALLDRRIHLEAAVGHPGVVRVSAPGEARIASIEGAPPSAIVTDPTDPNIVTIDARSGAPVAVLFSNHTGLLLRGAEVGLLQIAIAPSLEPIGGGAVGAWCAGSSDGWLEGELSRRVAANQAWDVSVAAGLYARLRLPSERERSRLRDGGLRGGQLFLSRPYDWARTLSPPQLDTVIDLSLAAAHALLDELDDVYAGLDDLATPPAGVVADICLRRDELECVRVLLDDERAARLAPVLAAIDQTGTMMLSGLDEGVTLDEEQLRRVAAFDPGAWWGSRARF